MGGLFVYHRGGIPYFVVQTVKTTASPLKNFERPSYLGRKDLYASLPSKDAAIAFAGDSLVSHAPWEELLDRPVLQRGLASDTVEGLRLRIGEVLRHHPRQLFVMIGVNDLVAGSTSDDVWSEYEKLIQAIRTVSPQTQLFLHSILPVNRAKWSDVQQFPVTTDILRVNRKLQEAADQERIVYLDLYSHLVDEHGQLNTRYTEDGVHLNGAGYLKWRDVLRPYISSVAS
jgi:lysophospholipase L1-like esterase